MFAAIQADAAQAAGGALGFANPALYQRAGTGQLNDVVEHPIGAPEVVSAVVDHGLVDGAREARLYRLGADHGLGAAIGYDGATGLGTPTAAYLLSYRPVVKPGSVPVAPSKPVPVTPSKPFPVAPSKPAPVATGDPVPVSPSKPVPAVPGKPVLVAEPVLVAKPVLMPLNRDGSKPKR